MKYLLLGLLLSWSTISTAQDRTKAEDQVYELLQQQVRDWNSGDLDGFMDGYWQDDDLVFMSSRGVRKGWDALKAGYSKGYPDADAMGRLAFEDLDLREQSKKVVTVHGRFIQDPAGDDDPISTGYFLLVAKKIKGDWKVIYDHTSAEVSQ